MYKIEYKKSIKKDLKNLDKSSIKAILREIESLKNGIDGNNKIIKLKGDNPYYRLRTGNYRIIFEKKDDILVIIVIKIGHRQDIYNHLHS
ncbi:MAG: type II toxin-antitoxin system RelE/ParE family toxin [bacterium]